MKEISLLEKSIINSKIFDSKIKTCSVSWKEKYLGHLIGPLGLILVVNTVAALVEKFFRRYRSLGVVAHFAHKVKAGQTPSVVSDLRILFRCNSGDHLPVFGKYSG